MVAVNVPAGDLSRRRVIQGALWATPAVLVASAVPASASSLEPESPSGYLEFRPDSSVVETQTVGIQDLGWQQRRLLVVNPDLQNRSPIAVTVTGVTLTYSIPKAWLPGGSLAWHGLRGDLVGGGTPPLNGVDFAVTVTDGPTHVMVTLLYASMSQWGMFSPEYRVEIAADAPVVGQDILVTARGTAGSEVWVTPWVARIA